MENKKREEIDLEKKGKLSLNKYIDQKIISMGYIPDVIDVDIATYLELLEQPFVTETPDGFYYKGIRIIVKKHGK